eukprot:s348_g8.t2
MVSDVPRFCVLGGGIAGLASARLLQRQLPHAQITVLEESDRLGGLVQTARGPKGQILEQGFHSSILVNRNGREALGLAKMLKLDDEVLGANIEASARRHLLHRGRVQIAPAPHHVLFYGPALMAEPLWPRGRQSDESVAAFTSRRGSRSLARHLADPICRGQLAGKAEDLSVRTCFPRLWHNEQRFGSVFIGAGRFGGAFCLPAAELDGLGPAAHSFTRIAPNVVSKHTRQPRFIRAEACRQGMFNVTLLCGAARSWPERKMFSRNRRVLSETFDAHAAAVRSWLDKLVIGMNLCPWAGKADESGGIRVVTSLGSAPAEVLKDLQREAAALPCEPRARPGAATTSLVVCPHVKAWQEFEPFAEFFGETLKNGVAFEDDLGVKLVAFHPQFQHQPLFGSVLEVDDILSLPLDGALQKATVLDPDAGHNENGEDVFLVRLEDGSEKFIAYTYLAELLEAQGGDVQGVEEVDEQLEDLEESEDLDSSEIESDAALASIPQRAPRPTFHLLRLCDVSAALADPLAGDQVLEQNVTTVQKLGIDGWQHLMSQWQWPCEEPGASRNPVRTDPLLQRVATGGRSYTFRNGLSSLTDTLEESLQRPAPGTRPAEIRLRSAVQRLEEPAASSKIVHVCLGDGSRVDADCVIAAIPPHALGGLLQRSLKAGSSPDNTVWRPLTGIQHKSVAVVNVCFDKDVLKERRLRGAGYFIGSYENQGQIRKVQRRPLESRVSAKAARRGFQQVTEKPLNLCGVDAESGVSAQPRGFEETRRGAQQRLRAARETAEGARADFCIAFEGGIEEDAHGRQVCFAIVCAQFRDDDFISEVRSATHSLPPGIEKLINEGVELGLATDQFFASRVEQGYGKHTGGTIGALTFGAVDRVAYYAQPAALCLVPFLNASDYGISENPLVPAGPAAQSMLAMSWDSQLFPEQGASGSQMTLYFDGDLAEETGPGFSEEAMAESALEAVKQHLGIQEQPSHVSVKLWQDALPQYRVGHHMLLQDFHAARRRHLPWLQVCGPGYFGTRNVADEVVDARELTDTIVRRFMRFPHLIENELEEDTSRRSGRI